MVVDLPLKSFYLLIGQKLNRYFTLAHQIAHNLVQLHNSEHEFYSSSIFQKFLTKLTGVIITEQGQAEKSCGHALNQHKAEREATQGHALVDFIGGTSRGPSCVYFHLVLLQCLSHAEYAQIPWKRVIKMVAYNVANSVSFIWHCALGGGGDNQSTESNPQNESKSSSHLNLLNGGNKALSSQTLEQDSPRMSGHPTSNLHCLYLPFTPFNPF